VYQLSCEKELFEQVTLVNEPILADWECMYGVCVCVYVVCVWCVCVCEKCW